MYVHVIGWETAKKDKIDLEGSRLKEKQGLYTCPPSGPQQLPFHCCLEVKEEQIKVQTASCYMSWMLNAVARWNHILMSHVFCSHLLGILHHSYTTQPCNAQLTLHTCLWIWMVQMS